jgi:branched-chain amino acid transport system ATP-binding protein
VRSFRLLKIENLTVGYDDLIILRQISLEIKQGQIVALIGANGAGKTTTLKTISGLLRARGGQILFDGNPVHTWPSHKIVKAGLIQVPEGRHLFLDMTVLENLELGTYRRGKGNKSQMLEQVYAFFPKLEERKKQHAGTLSGGERQMLAIGRALMSQPRLLMLDEPSLGLAPLIVLDIFRIIQEIRDAGTTVLIVEQNAVQTLGMADWGYVLENGKIVLGGTGAELLANEQIRVAYLGL